MTYLILTLGGFLAVAALLDIGFWAYGIVDEISTIIEEEAKTFQPVVYEI